MTPCHHTALTPKRTTAHRLSGFLVMGLLCSGFSAVASLPDPRPLDHFQNLWEQSAFDRTVLADAGPAQPDAQYVLIGVARFGSQQMLTVLDKTTNKTHIITSTADENSPRRLLELNYDRDPKNVSATAIIDGATVALRYDTNMLANRPGYVASASPPVPVPVQGRPTPPRQPNVRNPAQASQPGTQPGTQPVVRRRIIRPPPAQNQQ